MREYLTGYLTGSLSIDDHCFWPNFIILPQHRDIKSLGVANMIITALVSSSLHAEGKIINVSIRKV